MSKNNRRNFIQKAGALAATAFFSSVTQSTWAGNREKALHNAAGVSAEALSTEEDFWYAIQQSFTVSRGIVNSNNGGVSPEPKVVQDDEKVLRL